MNGKGRHFQRFKSAHRHGMQVAQVDTSVLTVSNGNGHEHLPDRLPWRLVWRERLRKVWTYVVAKAEGKFTVREGVAYVVLAAALAFGGASYWKQQEQHDELIRLRTLTEVQTRLDVEQNAQIGEARATAQIADRNAARLEGKFDQFSQIYAIGNPKKNVSPMRE